MYLSVVYLWCYILCDNLVWIFFFFQAEDGIRDLVRSRGLGDVYKRQHLHLTEKNGLSNNSILNIDGHGEAIWLATLGGITCLLYTSDAADERSSVDLGGRRIIKKKKKT